MISQIVLKDFAIVESIAVDLDSGMTALTGETGAGKSILLDAIGLALGDRAVPGTVRHGAKRADINVSFEAEENGEAFNWLQENEFAPEDGCVVRRVIASEGRSKCYINGIPVTQQILKKLGEMLVDIHGQHEHQSLIKSEMQRSILDSFSKQSANIEILNRIYKNWVETKKRIEEIKAANAESGARKEYLRFQIDEIKALSLGENEYSELESELKILANSKDIIYACEKATNLLIGDDAISARLSVAEAVKLIETIDDNKIAGVVEMLTSALIQIDEGSEELGNYYQSIDTDPQRLEYVENRISQITDIARKHGVEAEELGSLCIKFSNELNELENISETEVGLQQSLEQYQEEYNRLAEEVSKNRNAAAVDLGKKITGLMQELGMSGGQFDISVKRTEKNQPQSGGMDVIEYLVSANAGQPLKPLGKVASGGELSRISLALQVAVTDNTSIPTLIFDEVDTGIGGGIAEIVGNKLRELGNNKQVLCVTHLPQVASRAHNHLKVKKRTENNSTSTGISELNQAQRVEEIARMLGGIEITENSINHAREMLAL